VWNTWMTLWFVTSMTFLFFPRIQKNMNGTCALFWTNWGKLGSMPSWKNVNSIEPKWNSLVTSFLDMEFIWIFVRFRPLWNGLHQFMFVTCNVFLDLPIIQHSSKLLINCCQQLYSPSSKGIKIFNSSQEWKSLVAALHRSLKVR